MTTWYGASDRNWSVPYQELNWQYGNALYPDTIWLAPMNGDSSCGIATSEPMSLSPGDYTLTFGNCDEADYWTPQTRVDVRSDAGVTFGYVLAQNTNAGWEEKRVDFHISDCQSVRVELIAMQHGKNVGGEVPTRFGYVGGMKLGHFRLVKNN